MPRSLIGGEQVRDDDSISSSEHPHELNHFFIALVDVPVYSGSDEWIDILTTQEYTTFSSLSNTPSTYEARKYLITTGSDFEWVTISDVVGPVGSQGAVGA
jgi:hypothetical protein